MTEKTKLIKRWETKEGKILRKKILGALKRRKKLEKVKDLKLVSGKYDLRGIKFPQPGEIIFFRTFAHLNKPFILKNLELNNIDFSFADLSYIVWINCVFNFCFFKSSKMKNIDLINCEFYNSIFINCNLSDSFLNLNRGKDSGIFYNTNFVQSNLRRSSFRFPIIENCLFDSNDLFEVDFDGSRFKNCKFRGRMDSVWFKGYSIYARKSILGIFQRVNPQKYPNKMENIDFSEAKLIGVDFIHGIDLNKCIFPKSDDYLIVKNLNETYKRALEIIEKDWVGEDKRIGKGYVTKIFFRKEKHNMNLDIIDKYSITDEGKDTDFGEKLFRLIKSVNN